MTTVQLRWVRETVDDTVWVEGPDEASMIGVYIGEPGAFVWVADFGKLQAHLAVQFAQMLADTNKYDLDIPHNMRKGVRVRDGFAPFGTTVWWLGEQGPQRVPLIEGGRDHHNAIEYPDVYAINLPAYKTVYES